MFTDVRDEGGNPNASSNPNLIFSSLFYDHVSVSSVYAYFAADLKIVIDILGMVAWIFDSKVKSSTVTSWDRKGMRSTFKAFLENL